ncbi:polymer-forming cytoskeletal protein [Sphingomonas sp. JC676]|uniref:bactofilin family protein n=1 Tax=Sphingomonas sp. JC676 TaxID=2768065 RepID=UPI001657C994|nr:polymer-forming cytoskeletal protein [Sphingomonas sp. JC676]MBC9033579.1 polymer-forming cytoskeletal protein [Sphingomonas sp. JC676]
MFNSNRSRDDRSAAPAPQAGPNGKRGMFSVVGADVVVTGNVTATADLHIDGRIEGDVNCGNLAQGADSQIFGSVTAETARIAGTIEGAVRAKQLTVERSARIIGDVEYQSITIENGGHVEGRMKHIGGGDSATGPRAVPTAANEEAA